MITSKDNEKIKYIRKLRLNKYIKEEEKFIIEGENLVKEAYNSGILLEVYSIEELDIEVKTTLVSYDVMKSISNLNTPSKVLGICKIFEFNDELSDKIIILDKISDPGNLGTIIRSATAFDFDMIVLSNDCTSIYNEKVIRASEGMIFKNNIVYKNLLEFVPFLIKNGYDVYGTSVVNGINVSDIEKNKKIAFIIGNEGNGISGEVKELIDKNLYIKMNKNCESLNAAVASSIIMYELSK